MQAIIKKAVLPAAFAAAALFAGNASADVFNPFSVVAPGKGSATHSFTADKITGNYNEVVTFNTNGTFDVSLMWNAGQFVTNGGQTALTAKATGLSYDYGIYALYTASGTYQTVGGVTTFNFSADSGSLAMYLDRNVDTQIALPKTGTGAFRLSGSSDDILLASGDPQTGFGTLNPALSTCKGSLGNGINCGSFGSTTTFDLTSSGASFFVEPDPFYSMSFQSGHLNIFSATGTQMINGSLDVVFDTLPTAQVPEPASLGLLGLGLLGVGVARRRKQG